jgi:Family of unknown function (DUF5946)
MTQKSEQASFYELSCYTTSHPDPRFIHQYVVDAYAAQCANENTKPIIITFALIGLYLHIEKNFSGKEVQRAHIKLGKYRKKWPKFNLPEKRGDITISDVIATPEGPKRDEAILYWCADVWNAYSKSREQIISLVKTELWSSKD